MVSYLCSEYRFNKFSLQAKAVAFELITADEVVSVKVESWPSMHDICYDLCETTLLVTIKHVLVCLQVAV